MYEKVTQTIKYNLFNTKFVNVFKMQNSKLRPKRMIDIEADCVKAVNTYMQVKAESNDFIKLVYNTICV